MFNSDRKIYIERMKKNGFTPLDEIMATYEITEKNLVDLKFISDNSTIDKNGYKYLILGHLGIIFTKDEVFSEMLLSFNKTKIQIVKPQPPKKTEGLGWGLLFLAFWMATPVTYNYFKEIYPIETNDFIINAAILVISLIVLTLVFTMGIKKLFEDFVNLLRQIIIYSILLIVIFSIIFFVSSFFTTGSNSTSLCFYKVGCLNE